MCRFANGAEHSRRRALAVREIEALDVDALCRGSGDPVAALCSAMGLPSAAVDLVSVVAPAYQPGSGNEEAADAAVAELLRLVGGEDDEVAAARVCVLVQAAATRALVAQGGVLDPPPVPATRRVDAGGGEPFLVSLDGIPFGYGPRRCPGEAVARALAS